MSTAPWGGRGRTSGTPSSSGGNGISSTSSSSASSSGLCVTGTACRFGSSRGMASAADNRLIKIEVEGEEVLVDRYDVRLLLGDVASFARQNCSKEWRLAELQESREIEEMRYEDLPRRSAFSDDLPTPPEHQQEQQQWTPTLEQHKQQQVKKQRTMTAVPATAWTLGDQTPERPDYSAVPPPDALEQPGDTSAKPGGFSSKQCEQATEAARKGAAGRASEISHCGTFVADADKHAEEGQQQDKPTQQLKPQNDGDCFIPPFPDLPGSMRLPETLREYLVIERTAHFVREEGDRMEFRLLLDEERRLPFLSASHPLHHFYTWLKQQGHSLVAWEPALLPPRVRALLEFACSVSSTAELPKQGKQEQMPESMEEKETKSQPKQQQGQDEHKQQQEQPKHDPDGGLGLLLSYGSDEDDDDTAVSPQQKHAQQDEENQHEKPEMQQLQECEQQQQRQEQTKNGEPILGEPVATAANRRKPPPAPPLPSTVGARSASGVGDAAGATAVCGAKDHGASEVGDSEEEDGSNNPQDLTALWRSLRVTRFTLKKKKLDRSVLVEKDEEGEQEDTDMMIEALPKKPPWALPNAKLGLSKASALAIQQLGHHLLSIGDLSLVRHAKTASAGLYEDDASPFPFLRTSSMDLRYFRYVLKCVETEMQKEGFAKPQPLSGSTHELARSFLARLQLNYHLQQRKQKLLQECMRLSADASENSTVDYLRRIEAAAAAAADSSSAGTKSSTDGAATNAGASQDASTSSDKAAVAAVVPPPATTEAAAATGDPATTAYFSAVQSQIPPETAAHLQMLLQQMAAASVADDAATYMACYSAYCYALAGLSPEAASATPAATAAMAASPAAPSTTATVTTAAPTLAAAQPDVQDVVETATADSQGAQPDGKL
ncbi:splicing factor, arginine/serine-rich 8, putative [Eimeria tenella]|uniref:Splicing factor, arginine/serine-rich 8, putative n=1 Tax=Eimeria tenella TaxID=5802 RepID=U6KQU6_EIMTE|nr:splicing factor, arginine/serine-rich 8, putative [Eimeria tenella]CDJ40457.1 splicing factor, arginine/serine-rich 8, putative [Eimeria tenella]|eukprot:XP_013231207.1 splicing factor, arginine/serine-rich 8, putative [Eimeria tenella]